jgi:hypothetical protein
MNDSKTQKTSGSSRFKHQVSTQNQTHTAKDSEYRGAQSKQFERQEGVSIRLIGKEGP